MTDNAVADSRLRFANSDNILIVEEPSPISVSAAAATISATDRADSRAASFAHDAGGFRRFLEFFRAYSADEEPNL